MNKFSFLYTSIICGFISLFASCQKGFEDEEDISSSLQPLKVVVRSADENAEICYPLHIYAFNQKGENAARQTIESEEEAIELELPKGDFHIFAIAGCSEEYSLPERPKITDKIQMEDGKGAKNPIMTGKADISIGDKSSRLEITLSYAVTAISVELKGLPADVASVSLSLSPMYSSLLMSGEYEDKGGKIEIPCWLDTENIWNANTLYTFPGSGEETTLSILVTKKDGTETTYAYTYKGIPEANRAFNVSGNYTGGITVGGEFIVKGWEEPIQVNFDFGLIEEESGKDDTENEEDNSGEEEEDNLNAPEVGSIWNDAIVVNVEGSNVLVMSLEEWACYADELNQLMEEIGTDGWDLPTTSEARLLNQTFQGNNLSMLNDLLWDNNYDQIDETKRYFYNHNGYIYAFGFKSSSQFREAGLKTKYRLRLVKTIKLS